MPAPHYLDKLFAPHSVAVFGAGASADSVGGRVWRNLRGSFGGRLYAINPRHRELEGSPCHPDLEALGQPVDLAVVATPAATVPGILRQCGEHGVRAAIILSAGFTDAGRPNALHRAILDEARRWGLRLLGPNCLGLLRPRLGLNASFSNSRTAPGGLALVSQSGALCTAVLDWAGSRNVGFSAVVSLGDAADIDFGDVLEYLALDAETRGIILYIEGVREARAFMSGLRSAARLKPVVAMKVGRHAAAARAALSHTGAMVGSDEVFDAALRRAGVLRVQNFAQLFSAAQLLASEHRAHGPRLLIVTNGGGPGIMAVDRAQELGMELAQLSPPGLDRLRALLPAYWQAGNPLDLLGDAPPGRYVEAVRICLDDPGVDAVLVLLTPQAMTRPLEAARGIAALPLPPRKTLLTCWMGFEQVEAARRHFAKRSIPTFQTPESAVEAFAGLLEYLRSQELLLQVPAPLKRDSTPDLSAARRTLRTALDDGRRLLSRSEANAVLEAFGIPVTGVRACAGEAEVLSAADELGYPLAMKIDSPDIAHKTEVDGVRLNLADPAEAAAAFRELCESVRARRPEARLEGVTLERMYGSPHARELSAGIVRDAVFGPVVSFGAGGTMVEILGDRATALPPLNSLLIEDLVERTRVSGLLGPFRNRPPADRAALAELLRHVSELACELPEISELDLNPFVLDEHGAMVLDARIVVEPAPAGAAPYAHMAIHPYPAHLAGSHALADGTTIRIRPIRPEDAAMEKAFVAALSEESRYLRFMRTLRELDSEMLQRFTQIDYDREMALIALLPGTEGDTDDRMLGVARYTGNPDGLSCDFAITVADAWIGRGIATELMKRLMEAAKQRGLRRMDGAILAGNAPMLELAAHLGFHLRADPDDAGMVLASRTLEEPGPVQGG